MKISLSSVMVDDQSKALRFYTDVLGFVAKRDFPMGVFRWLTVASRAGHGDVELLLEPNGNPTGKTFQKTLFDQGIPATSFESADVAAEYARLKERGVVFRQEPTTMGPVTLAVFEDGCGNLIQMHQGGS